MKVLLKREAKEIKLNEKKTLGMEKMQTKKKECNIGMRGDVLRE